MNKTTSLAAERWVRTAMVAVAAQLVAAPPAQALGLGRLAVQSAIGESLRAEIDITSLTPEEAANLTVRIAPPESYRSAGVDYNPVLPGTQASVLRRADGKPYVRLTSDRSVLEPFVDVILEVSWSSGRLVREYTLLFDPPSQRNLAAAPPPVLPAAEAPPAPSAAALAAAARAAAASESAATPPSAAVTATAPAAAPEPRPIATRPAPVTTARAPAAPASAAEPAARREAAGPDSYTVRRGDTLSRIAGRTQRPGVSLDQMLVSLYQGNPDAFVGANMNRLKSGAVLNVPSAETARAVPADAARQTIQAQSADFGAYRQRLASGALPTQTESASRQASGSVQARVDDRQKSAAAAADRLTLSKNAASAAATAAAEDAISKQKERQASRDRLAELTKNVNELTRLSAAAAASTSANLARTAASAVAKPPVVAGPVASAGLPATRLAIAAPVALAVPPPVTAPSAPPPAPPSVAASMPRPTASPATAEASAPPSVAVAVATASAASPVVSMLPVQAPVRASSPSVAPPAPVVAQEPGSDAPSWWSDTPWLLPAAGALVVLLAALGLWRSRRGRRVGDVGETSFLESRLQPDSFFGASGGQRIDTHEASGGVSSSMTYSLSQLDAIGDVDPVAEADVYLAYGRDLQAEEILKEAMRGNPERLAIRTKLLEVYAKRRDTKGFELLATQMYKLTGGTGDDWAKAQELGAQIDPDNPLYQDGGVPPVPVLGDAERSVELLGASTLPQSVLPSPSQFGADNARHDPYTPASDAGLDLDLDLDFADAPAPQPGSAERSSAVPAPDDDDLSDFLGSTLTPVPSSAGSAHRVSDVSDVSDAVVTSEPAAGYAPTEVQPPNPPPLRAAPPRPVFPPTEVLAADPPPLRAAPLRPAADAETNALPAAPADAPLEFDLSSISLDFDPPPRPATPDMKELDLTPTAAGELFEEDDGADPLERKLDLAQEFHQIGDLEGARELLQEVMDRANGGLKDRAQRLLHEIGV